MKIRMKRGEGEGMGGACHIHWNIKHVWEATKNEAWWMRLEENMLITKKCNVNNG
jgi:hypothetical protein